MKMQRVYLAAFFMILASGEDTNKDVAKQGNIDVKHDPSLARMMELEQEKYSDVSFEKLKRLAKMVEDKYKEPERPEAVDKLTTKQMITSMRLGMENTLKASADKTEKNLNIEDCKEKETKIEIVGADDTSANNIRFKFRTYAPRAFSYIRSQYHIDPDNFRESICKETLREFSNPGVSGSRFFITENNEFIMKTVQVREEKFLEGMLPEYFKYLTEHPQCLLPVYYSFHAYILNGYILPFVLMKNLFPSDIKIHEKYDLKGSTFMRIASPAELAKKSPTYKDMDFINHHPNGIFIETDTYKALVEKIKKDSDMLKTFKIVDYSLLLGIHNIDVAKTENTMINEDDAVKAGAIQATNERGDRLLLFMGFIDILQTYGIMRELEQKIKAIIFNGNTSIIEPEPYASRIQKFLTESVFKKNTGRTIAISPSKREQAAKLPKNLAAMYIVASGDGDYE